MTLTTLAQTKPVLFVPGAMTGGWIWEDNFAQYFKEAGYDIHTMSFRGHQANLSIRLESRFNDYVDDCVQAIKACAKPPLIVAHSLGGLVALHAATKERVAGIVLLSPVPVTGMVRSMFSLAKKSLISLVKFTIVTVDARFTRYGTPPIGIYSDTCDDQRAIQITQQLKSESLPVLLKLLAPPKLEKTKLDSKKIFFIGATGDYIVPHQEVVRSASHIGSRYKIYEGLSHTYQAESSWPTLANDVWEFFETCA